MKSDRISILEAYMGDLNSRFEEGNKVKRNDIVETRAGDRFLVVEASHNFNEIKKYDLCGDATAYRTKTLRGNDQFVNWVAVQINESDTAVFPYGDDGVSLVQKTTKVTSAAKTQCSIMEAYQQMLSPNTVVAPNAGPATPINEADIASKDDLKKYAMELAKAAFGDNVDEGKVDKIVDNAIKLSKDDWSKAAGVIKSSFTGG